MPVDYKNYPLNWKTHIRPQILKRAGGKCEKCGMRNYSIVIARTRCLLTEQSSYKQASQNLGFYHAPSMEKPSSSC